MTEDRLTHLFAEATDLVPSDALRGRISPPPSRREGLEVRGTFRRTPWFVLSGATAALAVAVLVLTPRESAAALLNRAAQNEATASARIRAYSFVDGAWRLERRGIVAGGWSRFDLRGGGLELDTPEGNYRRSASGGAVFRSEAAPRTEDGMTLNAHLRFLEGLGRRTTVTASSRREEDGRTVQDVTIDMEAHHERETITIDVRSELPLAVLSEARLAQGWTPTTRAEVEYPGPLPGAREFWAGIDRRAIVDAKGLTALWTRRLTPVQAVLRLAGGAALKVRDLRILPSGDVLMLYTGPSNLFARLKGEDGTRFGRINFDPNDGRMRPRNRPAIVLDGASLRGLWFAPLEEGRRTRGRVRLILDGGPDFRPAGVTSLADVPSGAVGQRGTFTLTPTSETADVPAWADAIDDRSVRGNREGSHDDMRIAAAYDHWLDAQGRSVEGTFQDRPIAGWWIPDAPPRPGLRHDPKASAAAAEAFRTLMAHCKARGYELNPKLVEAYLPRFEREARGE